MYAVDLHTHTRFFHGFEARSTAFDPVGARLLTALAKRRGLDALAVTNHDYSWLPTGHPHARRAGAHQGSDVRLDGGTAARGPDQPDEFLTLPGIEISTTRGHLLVVGPDPPAFTEPGTLAPDEAIDLAHERGCAAIIPHPFRASTVRETDATADAVEVNGKHTHHKERVALLAEERDCPIVGGSDAHYPVEVGRSYTRVDAEELTPESVVDAIRDGRVEPAVREYRLDRVLTPVYSAIHRLKGDTSS
ncbi:PHP domain-containing protein [Salinarchaeum sp. Harcht-Bsk1]|uniref:PHP domain-containing protein n=1 Tax=Salinarchaeum sp. Harcht-Bsk1 TaxID=1333523 RepID=UPI00034246E6|nr:CehA/McbA family metallohydrolase [Salinarchaeum sp. Harcht-Bsk1]AGN00866.1 PHP domain-containing protein [Salinarchaeum sp. Harcht-Bsk1]